MTATSLSDQGTVSHPGLSSLAREIAVGFIYWLVFLLVLEPDNVMKAPGLLWSQELMRIAGASILGASVTPALAALVRRYPVQGPGWIGRLAIEALCCAALAAILVALSCILADWFLAAEHRPLKTALAEEFEANWTLLTFAIAGLLAIVHAMRSLGRDKAHAPPVSTYLTSVQVKSRGRIAFVEVTDIDWIETQGNYLALHTATAVHLVRDSLAEFERKLDPAHFARIHRRIVVALDRVGELRSLGAGDAVLTLKDGTELRVSRGFRASLGSLTR